MVPSRDILHPEGSILHYVLSPRNDVFLQEADTNAITSVYKEHACSIDKFPGGVNNKREMGKAFFFH